MNNVTTITNELDTLIDHSRSMSLPASKLLDLQAQISGLRYTLGTYVSEAEGRMLSMKDKRDLHIVRGVIKLQAMDKKLSNVKAEHAVMDETDTELLHQAVIQAKIDHSGLKMKLDLSGDVLISIAQRVRRLENEAVQSNYQTPR